MINSSNGDLIIHQMHWADSWELLEKEIQVEKAYRNVNNNWALEFISPGLEKP